MKIERESEAFKPITITLETEEEARALMTAVGSIEYAVGAVGEVYLDIFDYLLSEGFEIYNTEGSIKIVGN